MPGENQLTLGGVTYSKNEVANKEVVTKERTNSKGVWEQYKEYNVTLKDGTKVTYEEQEANRQAAIDIQKDGSINFFGLKDAHILDNKDKDDVYRLMGCEFTNVNAYDSAMLFHDHDKISLYNREMEDGTIQKTNNNVIRINDGDDLKPLKRSNIRNGGVYIEDENGYVKKSRK